VANQFSTRKINDIECLAVCHKNGNKGIGMLNTTLPYEGVWDLLTIESPTDHQASSHKTTTEECVYLRWLSTVMVFVAYQSCTPWFEALVGHLTGTTALNTIKTIKFVILDDQNLPETIRQLLELLGLLLERKSRESISMLPVVSLKKAYKALGYKVTTSTSTTPRQTMVDYQITEEGGCGIVSPREHGRA
jgi:hypothetical protein